MPLIIAYNHRLNNQTPVVVYLFVARFSRPVIVCAFLREDARVASEAEQMGLDQLKQGHR